METTCVVCESCGLLCRDYEGFEAKAGEDTYTYYICLSCIQKNYERVREMAIREGWMIETTVRSQT